MTSSAATVKSRLAVASDFISTRREIYRDRRERLTEGDQKQSQGCCQDEEPESFLSSSQYDLSYRRNPRNYSSPSSLVFRILFPLVFFYAVKFSKVSHDVIIVLNELNVPSDDTC